MAESLPFYHLINSWLHRQRTGFVWHVHYWYTHIVGQLQFDVLSVVIWTPWCHTKFTYTIDNIYIDTDSLSHNDNQIKEKLFDSKFLQDKSTQVIFLQHQFTTYTIHIFLHSDLDPHNLKKQILAGLIFLRAS